MLDMFKYIEKHIKPDVAFWGGGSASSNIDKVTADEVVETMKKVTSEVGNVSYKAKTYVTFGAYDTVPFGAYRPDGENPVVDEWIEKFSQFLSDDEMKTFRKYGYYSSPLTYKNGTQIGDKVTKVISLNSNLCYMMNFYQMTESKDPGNMLAWLEQELSDLERQGGSAIIMSYIPNIDECTRQIGLRWHALMDRYQNVIRWSTSSHTRKEQFNVIKDMRHGKPILMNFGIASASTSVIEPNLDRSAYIGKLPSFTVMYMDPENSLPVDYETYTLDLVRSNKFGKPRWHRSHRIRESFDLEDLSP